MIKRTKRLEPVDRLVRGVERDCARRLAGAQQRLVDAGQRLAELERYREEYQQSFRARARSGLPARGLREFQVFIARLDEAIAQQRTLRQQLHAEHAREHSQWQHAAVRSSAVGKVIERARSEERQVEDRRAQRELDERAQRQGVRR
ncbi:MAG: flagellar export protein FliJ [Gammaproteobacteria bacterium]|nr:flagellar export protein FliJ [Gammaproteobacteria bacterium]